MKEPKHIPEPPLKSATALSAIEMNKVFYPLNDNERI